MTSKVSGKTRLGAVCCVLLIAIALFAGCKQETPESYAPPGYGVSVGPLTDTEWKATNGDTFKFAANGKVSVPDSLKTKTLNGETIELGDFTYTLSALSIGSPTAEVMIIGTVKKLPKDQNSYIYSYYDAETGYTTKTIQLGDPLPVATLTVNGKKAETANSSDRVGPYNMITSNYATIYSTTVPTKENYVGDYYDDDGRKILQINEDGTAISFANGIQNIQYWKYHNETDPANGIDKGTIWVADEREQLNDNEGEHGTYNLYPHAFMNWELGMLGDIGVYWK